MAISPESVAQPRRLSVSIKLGVVFLLLAITATGNLYLSNTLHDSIANIANIINQSGRLRYLSQQVAFQSASFVLEPGEAARQSEVEAENEFKVRYAGVAKEIGNLHPLMRSAGDNLKEHLGRIDKAWQDLHIALKRVLAEPDLAARQAVQREVAANATVMLGEADQLVDALEKAAHTANQRVDSIIYLVQALEILLMLWVFFYVRSRITLPILNLTKFTRRFAAGERDVRMDFRSSDEIGELVLTFNTTAAQTAELLDELDRRARENATLAAILEATTDIVATASPEGRILYFNRAGRKTLGLAGGEDLGRYTIADFHPPEEAERILHTVLPTVAADGPWAGESVLRSRTGVDIPVSQVILAHRGEDGAVDYYSSIMRDITERKRVEDSLRKLSLAVEQSPNSIIITDLDANIEYANATFAKATGYSLAEVIGQNPSILQSGRTPRATYDDLWAHLTRNETWKGELINRRKDGSEYIESVWVSPVRMADGRVVNYLAIQEDITERKRMEAELLQLNDELEEKVAARTAELDQARLDAEQANRAKSAFLSAMSHEIRTPMNGVIGMIDVLQQSSLNGAQIETANIIHDSAFALLTIIDDILDFSKIEAGKLQIDYAPMDVAGVVEGTCETLIPMALKKGVELTLFTDPGIPAVVMGDAGRLRQILVNLANNAIKFSSGQQRQGKVSLRAVLVKSTPDEHGRFPLLNPLPLAGEEANESLREFHVNQVTLEFRVTDNGIGIDKQTQTRLFSPFAQADTSTTRNFGGTGLGLAISRQLANIMDGEITVQSEPGKGSLFSVLLPFKLVPEQPAANVELSLIAGLTCLVADGSESLANDLAAYLEHAGAAVKRAVGFAAVKQWIESCPPGLCVVVVDTAGIDLPLDELRTAARVRPNADVRFVALERGGRRRCRIVATDLVGLDAEAMHRLAFLEAVAIAAGRAKQPGRESLHSDIKATPAPLSREEARQQGSLILVAEDNEINQKVILQQLTLLGRTADIASDGREALERWRSGDYGLLFTDLHMPEMDGYELTTTVRAAETDTGETGKPRIPIIAITANALKGEADHCRAIGMDDYLSKPVQLADLKAMLEKWMPVVSSDPIADEAAPAEGVGRAASPFATSGDSGQTLPAGEKTCRAEPDLQPAPPTAATSVAVDVNVLKALIGDDDEMIREFLHDFRLSAKKIAAELRAACAANQTETAGALAHKLKSSSRSVGALALGELCAALEKAGKGGDAEALATLLPKFEQELAGVERFLEGY